MPFLLIGYYYEYEHLVVNFDTDKILPCRVGFVVSVSASHMVGHGAPQSGYTKDHHKIGSNCLPAWHACVRVGD